MKQSRDGLKADGGLKSQVSIGGPARSESVISLSNLSRKLKSGTGKPLVIIEVDTNGPDQAGGIETIEVYKGDEPAKLAKEFCQRYEYDESTCSVLQK